MRLDDVESVRILTALLVEVGQHGGDAAEQHSEENGNPEKHDNNRNGLFVDGHRSHFAEPRRRHRSGGPIQRQHVTLPIDVVIVAVVGPD